MKRVIIIIVLLSLVFLGFKYVPKQSQKRMDGWHFGKGKIEQASNLSDEQTKHFNNLHYNHENQMIELKSDIERNRLELKHMLANQEIDDNNILNLTQANSEIMAEMKTSKVQLWLSIYKILDDEQKAKWSNFFHHMADGKGKNLRKHMKRNIERGERQFKREMR